MERDAKFLKIERVCTLLYLLFSLGLIVVYGALGDRYHLGISLGTPLIPAAIWLFYRVLRFKPAHQLNVLVLGFAFLAYPLGSCLDLYRVLPGFDKAAHTLSGAFVSILAMALFCAVRPGHRVERRDAPMLTLFTFFASMAVAGLWEIGEYLISMAVGLDLQRVAATGVSDSMQDMIVCMIGTLFTLPFAKRLADGRTDIVTGAVTAFVDLNLTKG